MNRRNAMIPVNRKNAMTQTACCGRSFDVIVIDDITDDSKPVDAEKVMEWYRKVKP